MRKYNHSQHTNMLSLFDFVFDVKYHRVTDMHCDSVDVYAQGGYIRIEMCN